MQRSMHVRTPQTCRSLTDDFIPKKNPPRGCAGQFGGRSKGPRGRKTGQASGRPSEFPKLGDVFDDIDTVSSGRSQRQPAPVDPWQPPIFDRPANASFFDDIDAEMEGGSGEDEEEEYGQADRRWAQPGALERYADAAYYEELERGLKDGTYQEIVSHRGSKEAGCSSLSGLPPLEALDGREF